MCFAPTLIQILPALPEGDRNLGHITRNESSQTPEFDWTKKKKFSSISNSWHPVRINYLSLTLGELYVANVYEATCDRFNSPVIAKFARFPYEISWYESETNAYSWIQGYDIGPKFLGHVTERDRIIGFLLEKVDGHHTGTGDLEYCRQAVERLHSLGIVHGDLNRHNFLVTASRAILIDFENARRTDDKNSMSKELVGLEHQLQDTSGRGHKTMEKPDDSTFA